MGRRFGAGPRAVACSARSDAAVDRSERPPANPDAVERMLRRRAILGAGKAKSYHQQSPPVQAEPNPHLWPHEPQLFAS